VDFANTIEFPVTIGQSDSGISESGQAVFVFTHEATADSSVKLLLRRTSGNLSIGVTVINQSDNSISFLAGLPTADNLSIDITFPADGTYAIGIFRLDITPNQVGTSGEFEITFK
jgi:hypothetical protein